MVQLKQKFLQLTALQYWKEIMIIIIIRHKSKSMAALLVSAMISVANMSSLHTLYNLLLTNTWNTVLQIWNMRYHSQYYLFAATLFTHPRSLLGGANVYMFYRCFFSVFFCFFSVHQKIWDNSSREWLNGFSWNFYQTIGGDCSLKRRAAAWRKSCRRLANGECWFA